MSEVSTPTLALPAWGLTSKWGFHDGEEPETYLDWLDDNGLPYPDDWHATLRDLVREHLMPLLAGRAVELVDIQTSHNPIRAKRINGHEVDWYDELKSPLPNLEAAVPFDVVYTTQLRYAAKEETR